MTLVGVAPQQLHGLLHAFEVLLIGAQQALHDTGETEAGTMRECIIGRSAVRRATVLIRE